MKRIIEKMTIYLSSICLILTIVGFILPEHYSSHNEIVIDAPKYKVWEIIHNMDSQKKWNVFLSQNYKLPSDLHVKSFGFIDTSEGINNKPRIIDVISDKQTDELIIIFDEPYIKSTIIKLKPNKDNQTVVSCEIKKDYNFPNNIFNPIYKEKNFNLKIEESLKNLKSYCENY